MATVNEKQAYEDLANAVVARACEDYLQGKKMLYLLDRGLVRSKKESKSKLVIKWTRLKNEGESFLRSERLAIFTKVSGEYLLSKLDEEFETWLKSRK